MPSARTRQLIAQARAAIAMHEAEFGATDAEVEAQVRADRAAAVIVRGRRLRAEGVDERAAEALLASLAACEEAWRGEDCIPRIGVEILLDLESGVEAQAYLYKGEEAERIRQLAVEIGQLSRAAVATPLDGPGHDRRR